MTFLKTWDGSDWVLALTPTAQDRVRALCYSYEAYLAEDLHDSTTRTFTLTVNNFPYPRREDFVNLNFVRLDIWARIGQLGSNSITYGTSTSEHVVTAPWSDTQFVKHFGFTEAPPMHGQAAFDVTTNYPMPTTDPSMYMFAIGIWN